MESKISTTGSAFAKALRSIESGGVEYEDFVSQVDELLDAGASPDELLRILERRDAVEGLPAHAREAVFRLMEDLRAQSAGEDSVPPEAPTVILGDGDEADRTSDDAHRSTVKVGDVLAQRYRLIELIGEGGMSRVYKALDLQADAAGAPRTGAPRTATPSTGAPHYVAVKVLKRPLVEDDASLILLQEEIRKLRSLVHPNIVRLYSCDQDATAIFLTMEHLVGESLYARLHGPVVGGGPSPVSRDEAGAVIAAVAEAVDFAHGHRVIHGDLKPGNVIATAAGEIKVIDFGMSSLLARPRSALERREAAQRQAALTPRYASPQLMARYKPETTDDVYALACLAYELFTGIHPFEEGAGPQALRTAPPMRPGLNAPQYAAVLGGLQFERRDRTPSVRQFLQEVMAPAPRRSRRKAVLWGAAAAILVAAAGWLLLRPAPPAAPPPVVATQPAPVPPTAAQPQPAVLPGAVLRDCPTCPQMTVLPPGQFLQGSADADSSAHEKPQHPVMITRPIAMSTHDVTVADFREFQAATGRDMQGCEIYDGEWRRKARAAWNDPGFPQTDTHPVTCASWNDAVAYAGWLSQKSGHRYRLPSASEWEYAARAGSTAARPWGSGGAGACADANVADQSASRRYPGWDVFACDDGYVNTAPVGSFKPNAFGLDDMLGNVFQWTEDCWHDDYAGAPADGSARLDGNCGEHELRGGSWFSAPAYLRPAYRNHFAAGYRTSSVGFRLVREDIS